MSQIIVTQRVAVELNKYLLEKIIAILRKKDITNTNYLQINVIQMNLLKI